MSPHTSDLPTTPAADAAPSPGIAYTADQTVNDILACHPMAIQVLNAFGMDTCCGGVLTLAEAARHDGVDLDAILHALALAAQGEVE